MDRSSGSGSCGGRAGEVAAAAVLARKGTAADKAEAEEGFSTDDIPAGEEGSPIEEVEDQEKE